MNKLSLYSFAKAYAKTTFKNFTSEDIRTAFLNRHPNFTHFNEFGNVMRWLLRNELVKKNGFKNSELPAAKGAIIHIYISKEYSELQANKRRYKQPTLF